MVVGAKQMQKQCRISKQIVCQNPVKVPVQSKLLRQPFIEKPHPDRNLITWLNPIHQVTSSVCTTNQSSWHVFWMEGMSHFCTEVSHIHAVLCYQQRSRCLLNLYLYLRLECCSVSVYLCMRIACCLLHLALAGLRRCTSLSRTYGFLLASPAHEMVAKNRKQT